MQKGLSLVIVEKNPLLDSVQEKPDTLQDVEKKVLSRYTTVKMYLVENNLNKKKVIKKRRGW